MKDLVILSSEIFADIRSAAWLESELHPELDRHRRHEMADICEKGNVDRVWRVLGVGVAEIRLALLKLLCPQCLISTVNELECPASWHFRFAVPLQEATPVYIKEKIHEYLVASVMADRTSVIIPQGASVWSDRADMALAALREVSSTAQISYTPVRRPLWPL